MIEIILIGLMGLAGLYIWRQKDTSIDNQWIHNTFVRCVGRAATPSDITYWNSQLDAGYTKKQIISVLCKKEKEIPVDIPIEISPDIPIETPPSIPTETPPSIPAENIYNDIHVPNPDQWIRDVFVRCLGRTAMPYDIHYWNTQLGAGYTKEQIIHVICST